MRKGTYKSVEFKEYIHTDLSIRFQTSTLVVGIDIAKEWQYACVMNIDFKAYDIVRFHTNEMRAFVGWLDGQSQSVVVIMEPTGTYGDPLVDLLRNAKIEVRQVHTKRVKDSQEIFDGVPSTHDGKAAYILARLHQFDISNKWKEKAPQARKIRAIMSALTFEEELIQDLSGKLEGMLARHWPEVLGLLRLKTATLHVVLKEFGGPREVAAQPDQAQEIMRVTGGTKLLKKKILAVIQSAKKTIGVPMDMVEEQILAHFASKIRDAYRKQREFERELNKLCESHEETAVLRSVYGPKLACAIMGWLGSVYAYKTAAQLEKSCGLNLKIRQSGKVANGLHLTKRGPSIVRKYLWFAAMRVIHPDQGDAIARAWYHKRLRLNGGNKRKALVALMRKLARAIFYVGRGEGFDATKLFDVRILQLEKNGVSV